MANTVSPAGSTLELDATIRTTLRALRSQLPEDGTLQMEDLSEAPVAMRQARRSIHVIARFYSHVDGQATLVGELLHIADMDNSTGHVWGSVLDAAGLCSERFRDTDEWFLAMLVRHYENGADLVAFEGLDGCPA